jgi:hypothetical protein
MERNAFKGKNPTKEPETSVLFSSSRCFQFLQPRLGGGECTY